MSTNMPFQVIEKIGNRCPRAIGTYILCVSKMDKKREIILTKKEINDDLCESYCKFRNDLKALSKEKILDWIEKEEKLHIKIRKKD